VPIVALPLLKSSVAAPFAARLETIRMVAMSVGISG
jgi:hypothetical protein